MKMRASRLEAEGGLTALSHVQFLVMAASLLFHDERGQILLKCNKGQ
jgi:hypothetical protein